MLSDGKLLRLLFGIGSRKEPAVELALVETVSEEMPASGRHLLGARAHVVLAGCSSMRITLRPYR
jgi:hypothetical protein